MADPRPPARWLICKHECPHVKKLSTYVFPHRMSAGSEHYNRDNDKNHPHCNPACPAYGKVPVSRYRDPTLDEFKRAFPVFLRSKSRDNQFQTAWGLWRAQETWRAWFEAAPEDWREEAASAFIDGSFGACEDATWASPESQARKQYPDIPDLFRKARALDVRATQAGMPALVEVIAPILPAPGNADCTPSPLSDDLAAGFDAMSVSGGQEARSISSDPLRSDPLVPPLSARQAGDPMPPIESDYPRLFADSDLVLRVTDDIQDGDVFPASEFFTADASHLPKVVVFALHSGHASDTNLWTSETCGMCAESMYWTQKTVSSHLRSTPEWESHVFNNPVLSHYIWMSNPKDKGERVYQLWEWVCAYHRSCSESKS